MSYTQIEKMLNSPEITNMFDNFLQNYQKNDQNKSTLFEDYLNQFADTVGNVINAFIPESTHPDMDKYLYDPLNEYSSNAGKRHRPLITIAACRAVGGDHRRAFSSAAAIEHFHTAALIHDDIADKAEQRRGKPCMHLTEGVGLAINAGDLALSIVNGLVMRDPLLSDFEKVKVATELVSMAQSTVEGQALDIGWARDNRYDITPDDYLCMATHKTAHYSGGAPLAIGAIVGGASENEIESLRQFGLGTGLAFQIQDDLLNLIGKEESTKKDFRNDITEGKRTLIVVHALHHSTQSNRLINILSSHEKDPVILEEAVSIMRDSGSIDYAKRYANEITQKAKNKLLSTLSPSATRDLLLSMADWFVERMQ